MFKAAFYEIEVTPPLGSFVPGHYAKIFTKGVKDRLYVKSLVIDNGDNTVAMVVLDCCEPPKNCHDIICKRVEEYTGIKAENITIAVNHTHAGAPTKSYPELNAYSDQGYIENVVKLMADAITFAYRKLEPVSVSYACGKVYGISFNRNFVMRDGRITTNTGRDKDEITPLNIPDDVPVVKFEDAHNNPGAKIVNPNCAGNLAGIDPDFPVLFFKNQKGEMIGCMSSFACHQTASGCTESSGDYSSILSKELKKNYGNEFVSLFLIGTAGDINHVDFSREECKKDIYKIMGKRLADEVKSLEQTATEITDGCLFAKKEKLCLKRRLADIDTIVDIAKEFVREQKNARKFMLRNILVYEARGYKDTDNINAYVQTIRIGDVFFYALPGEIFVDFGLYIKKNSPSSKNMIIELANGDYDGYVPTREVFHPNSSLYEKALCEGSCMEIEGGYIMSDKVLEFAKELSNK